MQLFSRKFLRENLMGLSLTLIGVLCLVFASVLYLGQRNYADFALASGGGLDGPDIGALENLNRAYDRIATDITPAIVFIESSEKVKPQQSPILADPFFRQFFGNMVPQQNWKPQPQWRRALGSGVIVSPDGYILTNDHVIRHATSIKVRLHDNREFTAKVVGADEDTDLAVLKIDARDLPAASLGNSDKVHVGDIVLAFGNPFGFNYTMTHGIVSALGRSAERIEGSQNNYVNFIQTDAPINPGNSGGALVDVRGQVIGINTAIVSGGAGPDGQGSFLGIGFAIPINTAKHVMADLVKTGKVEAGYLGVSIATLTPKYAEVFDAPWNTQGVLVQDVNRDGPASKAGLEDGDIIQRVNSLPVSTAAGLTQIVTNMNPGQEATLSVLRKGKPMTLQIHLGVRPSNLAQVARNQGGGNGNGPSSPSSPSSGVLKGVTVEALTGEIRQQLNLPAGLKGVVISQVDAGSELSQDLERGMVITAINHHPIETVAQFDQYAAEAKGQTLLRVFIPNQGGSYIVLGE